MKRPLPKRLAMRGVPFICTYKWHGKYCGRVIYSNDPMLLTWLIGQRVNDPSRVLVRCPQHITERTLRTTGRRRTKRMYRWAELAKEMDPGPQPIPPFRMIEVDPRVIAVAYYETKKGMKNDSRIASGHTRRLNSRGPWQQQEKGHALKMARRDRIRSRNYRPKK